MKKTRFAVIGAGNIAQVAVLPAFAHVRETCELAALISGDPKKRDELAHKHGIDWTGPYEQLEAILKDGHVQAAYVTLPNHLHREYTERCAAVGVHVLCEKPMAMSVEACRAMITACEAARVKLMIAYRLHFEETNLRTIELIRQGTIGKPRFVSSVFSHEVRDGDIRTQADAGGGALYDLGVYCVNAARFLFGDEPLEVTGFQTGVEVDEMTTALLRFPGDRFAQLAVSQSAASTSELRIVGTRGDIRLEPAFDYTVGLKQFITIDDATEERTFEKRDQFAPELEYFASCIQHDIEPEPDGLEGLADVRVLEAIVQSAAQRAAVRLGPFDRVERPDMSQNIKKPPVEEQETVNAPSPSR